METDRAVRLTDYIVSTPPLPQSLLLIFAIGLLFGIFLAAITKPADSFAAIGGGIFLIVVPALLTALTFKLFKRRIPLRHIMFLCAVGAFVYSVFYLAGIALTLSNITSGAGVVLLGFAIVFVVWFLIAKVVFNLHRSSFIVAIIQLFYNSLFLLTAQYMVAMTSDPLSLLFKIYLASLTFLLALYTLFWLINAPMKRSFGVSSIDAVTMFLSQWLYQSKELEEALTEVGQESETIVGVVGFKGKKTNAFFITPAIHFGPFGNLGGSEFSALIADYVAKKYKATAFVFHGTATHDFNPVSSSELSKVTSAISRAIDSFKYKQAIGTFSIGRNGTARALALTVNGDSFIGLTRAPHTTEDINFGVGLALKKHSERWVDDAIIADAHNSETGEIRYVEPGDSIFFEMESAITHAIASQGKGKPICLGVASRELALSTVGKNGLKVAVFETGEKNSRERFILLLLDSNGVTPAFRRELLDSVVSHARAKGIRAKCEVFTTDTHQVNVVRGVLNPAGSSHQADIIKAATDAFEEAITKLEPVTHSQKTERFMINVLGPGQSAEIVSTVNAVVAILKIAAPLILIGATILILLVVAKL